MTTITKVCETQYPPITGAREMRPTATDVTRSMVCVSVCPSHGWDVQRRLNQSRCYFGYDSWRNHVLDGRVDLQWDWAVFLWGGRGACARPLQRTYCLSSAHGGWMQTVMRPFATPHSTLVIITGTTDKGKAVSWWLDDSEVHFEVFHSAGTTLLNNEGEIGAEKSNSSQQISTSPVQLWGTGLQTVHFTKFENIPCMVHTQIFKVYW